MIRRKELERLLLPAIQMLAPLKGPDLGCFVRGKEEEKDEEGQEAKVQQVLHHVWW